MVRVALAALVFSPLAVVASAPPAEAVAPTVTVSISGGGQVIAGDNATYSISAHNAGTTVDGFNLGLILDVPVGVTFVSSTLGTPVIYDATHPPTTLPLTPIPPGFERWVWEDVSDLPAGGTYGGSVTVHPTQPTPRDSTGTVETSATNVFPVGSSYVLNVTAALGGNPTYLPVFNGATGVGGSTAIAETGTAGPNPVTTNIIALDLRKSEPSPEAELLRGVHNQTTIYTLTVRNTTEGPTHNTVLVDHIPAGLEYLGCGGVDNSTVDRYILETTVVNEYDGAPRLTGTPPIATNCPTPIGVDTVVPDATLAATYGLTVGAVYTQVTWNLGTLAAGETRTVRYAAAVPLYENTARWDGASTPTPASLGQTANLDNNDNNGPSTRHGDPDTPIDGDTWTNIANVTGTYAGIVRTATPRATPDRATTTIYAMDLSILKAIDPADTAFEVGNDSNFTLTLRASEYMKSSAIVVTDELPNGLCPLMPLGTPLTIESGATVPSECMVDRPVGGAVMVSVTAHADGTFTIVFRPTSVTYPNPGDFVLAPNTTHAITYIALDRSAYKFATLEYGPTTSGDSFGNTVSFVAVTDAIPPILTWFPPTWKVWDDSGSTIESDLTTISKRVMLRGQVDVGLAPGVDPCTHGTFGVGPEQDFRLGDTVCFELTVTFPSSIDVRNPVITDFLPTGLTYQGYAVIPGSVGPIIPAALDPVAGRLQWELGTLGDGGDLYVPRGKTFVAHLWAVVSAPSSGPILDKPENLMKYRQQNVLGELYFLRDQAAIEIDPEIDLIKGIQSVTDHSASTSSTRPATTQDNADGSVFASNRDGIMVREGEIVKYRIDLRTMPYGATNAQVWDALPAGVTKSAVTAISDSGVALNPGDPGYPAGIDPTLNTRSIVMWTGVTVPYDGTAHEARKTLNYSVTVPVRSSVATSHTNEASVISYQAAINTSLDPSAQTYYPTGSFNVGLTSSWNTPGTFTRDDSNYYLPSATIAKTATSPVGTNNTATQVVKGEIFQFTYGATVPAYTSVQHGVLSDALVTPAGNWSIDPTQTTVNYPGGPTAPGATSFDYPNPGDTFTINTTTGSLTFPALYTNPTGVGQLFQVNLYGHVTSGATWTNDTGTRRNDTATFASDTQPSVTATSGVYVIEPQPTIAKVVSASTVTAGQTVTYTLTANNTADRPILYDAQVVDCVPAGLAVITPLVAPSQGSVSIIPDASCPTGTRIVWDVGDIAASSAKTFAFQATVDPASAGNATYTNPATIIGWSLPAAGSPDRASYTATATRVVTVAGATDTKTVDVPTATIGQKRSFTVTINLPALVNFYDTAIIDDVPAGMTVSNVAVTCTYGAGGDCMGTLPGGATTLTPSGTNIGWWLGDVLSNADTRSIRVTYTGTVRNTVGNVNGAALTDTAQLRWAIVNTIVGPPADAGYTGTTSSTAVSATVTVREPALTISKLVNGVASAHVNPGSTFNYAVLVTNTGTSTAYNATIRDVVPVGVVVNPATISDGGTLSGADPVTGGGTISWTWASLANVVPNSHTFTYSATLAPSSTLNASGRVNSATVTQYFSHPLATPGFDDTQLRTYAAVGPAQSTVTPDFPSPTITKTPALGLAYIGQSHSFSILVTNAGLNTASAVTVVDTLPANWVYDAGSTTVGGVGKPDPAIAGQDLTWTGLPSLAPVASATIVYTAHPDAAATWTVANTGSAYNHRNNVTVTVHDTSGAPGNLLGTYTATNHADVYIHRADLWIDKAHSGSPVAGSAFSWTLTVNNPVTSDPAVGPIRVVDVLPTAAVFDSFTGTGWLADTTSVPGQVTFTHDGPVPTNGALPIITVNVTLAAGVVVGTNFDNDATVSALTFDPDHTNNSDHDGASTAIVADVFLAKTTVAGTLTAGEGISWHLQATNNGPSVAVAPFTITDTLPPTVDWDSVSYSGVGWTCDLPVTVSGDLVCRWSSSTLAVWGSTTVLTVNATILPSATARIYNTATVTHLTPDTDILNNTATTTSDPIGTSADLSLNKTTVSIDIPADGIGRFRIAVANSGPSDALNVTVADTLPRGLTYAGNLTAAPGDTWTCVENIVDPAQVDCTLDSNGRTLPLGGSTWFEFDVQADSSVTAAVLNFATVSSDTPDPRSADNTDDSATAPNLIVNKTVTPASVARGSSVIYTINVESMSYGATDDVTLTDPIPASLRVTNVAIGVSSDPTVPNWPSCGLVGTDVNGYGGTITCVLAGTLERGRTTPDITVTAVVNPTTTPGSLINVATVRWTDPLNAVAVVFSAVDDATIAVTLTHRELAGTGPSSLGLWINLALIALILGSALMLVSRRMRDESEGS